MLRLNLKPASHDLENRLARFARRLGNVIEEAAMAHQRGAILIPPSSRTAAAFMYGFSIRKQASLAYSSAWPSRFGNGTCAPSASWTLGGIIATIGVLNTPGSIVLTRTPSFIRSRAIGSVMASTPPLEAE